MTLADLAPARAPALLKPPVREDCAGFWRRTGAAAIDAALITLYVLAVAFAIIVAAGGKAAMDAWPEVLFHAVVIAGAWLYLALGDSSASGATVGKRFARIAVVDRLGRRVGFARATVRFLARLLSVAAFLGWFLILATKRRQALHDLLSGCLVVHAARAQSHRESP